MSSQIDTEWEDQARKLENALPDEILAMHDSMAKKVKIMVKNPQHWHSEEFEGGSMKKYICLPVA